MAKPKTSFTCTECGAISSRWMGQCAACHAWNTMVESVQETAGVNRLSQQGPHRSLAQTAPVLSLADIEAIVQGTAGTRVSTAKPGISYR